jgi:hypothetical protein
MVEWQALLKVEGFEGTFGMLFFPPSTSIISTCLVFKLGNYNP